MNAIWGKVSASINARNQRERIIILFVVAILIINFWFLLVEDNLNNNQSVMEKEISSLNTKIILESQRFLNLQSSENVDPNKKTKNRISQLQTSTIEIDENLENLYGELILPEEMATVLSAILKGQTMLRLVSLENLPSERLLSAGLNAATPLVGGANARVLSGENNVLGVTVFKHGLELKFVGSYLDTIFYLRNLEALNSNFLWDDLSFSIEEYPNASVSFKIFTLSTQKEWIGV